MSRASLSASEALDRYFLEVRGRLLEVAATLDRIDRGEGRDAVTKDARRRKIDEAIRLLVDGAPERAERLQMLFSRAYDPQWLATFEPVPAETNRR